MKPFFFFSLLVLLAGTSAATPPHYTIERLGFFTGPNVASNGYVSSVPRYLNEQGQVAGYSIRYTFTDYFGQDAWLYTGTSTVQMGFTGAGYEKCFSPCTNGHYYRKSEVKALNDHGQVLGTSDRYSGTTDLGTDVWLYTGTGTILLGLTGPGYQTFDGDRTSSAEQLNDKGQVTGWSFHYSSDINFHSWLYTGTSTVPLGFTGPGYVKQPYGSWESHISTNLNDQGQVGGYSSRYSGSTELGEDVWLYTGTSTLQLGFTGPGYERSDGYRYSRLTTLLNDQGQVAGWSQRYSGTTDMGLDAWLYTGTGTIRLGLTGAEYENSNGYRLSSASQLNDGGQAAGNSKRYSGTTELGADAWLYTGTNTIQIGLTGPAFETSNGGRESGTAHINNQGQVTGYSKRFAVVTDGSWPGRGTDAWLYTGTSTILLGLTDANHERNDSVRISVLNGLNDQGQVIGYTNRYIGAASAGQDAWFYDSTLNQTFNLSPSIRPSDGYANSNVAYLNDDGVAVGSYELFDQNTSASLGRRAFYFSVADGFQDLGPLVEDLTEAGWSTLAGANKINGAGNVIGTGTLPGVTGDAAYLLKPVIQVQINVDPWSTSNQVKPNSPDAAIMVVIWGESVATGGTVDFDASQIDPASLKFGIGEAPVYTGPWVADGNSDSNADMLVGFRTGDSAIACGDTEVVLNGETFAGAPFEATDTIQTIDCETGGCHP